MQFSEEKNIYIKQLENENRELLEKVKMLEHNVELLTQAVLHASKQRFGASSEKTPNINGQCSLLGGITDEILDETKVINIKEHKRPVRKKGDRENLIKALPHEVIECIIEAEDATRKICGNGLKIIGKKKVRSEMEYIPAKLIIKEYIQYVYKCIECGKNDTNPYDSIYCAPVPAPLLRHSVASPSITAWIMYQKYMMSVPLYRQEKDFKRMGAELKRDMIANWIIRTSEYWLKPLYEEMHKQLLKCSIIMSDETTWQVNKEEGKKPSSKSYIWIHRSGNCESFPIILYQYTRSRSGDHAKKFLEDFMDIM
jgi:transposase